MCLSLPPPCLPVSADVRRVYSCITPIHNASTTHNNNLQWLLIYMSCCFLQSQCEFIWLKSSIRKSIMVHVYHKEIKNFKVSNKEWVIKNKEPNYVPPMLHVLNNKKLFFSLLVSLIMLPWHKCNLMTHRIQNFSLNWNFLFKVHFLFWQGAKLWPYNHFKI